MKLRSTTSRLRSRRRLIALITLAAAGAGAQTAFAAGSCADACARAFGVTFYNSDGDFFVLKDCATSDISGRTYCTYARLPATGR